jgi:uncharacterized protein (TIGR02996 family)
MGVMLRTATDGAFLATILEHPDDDAPRLVYADWLDEHGEGDRAEFIRLQIRLARLAEGDPDYPAVRARAEDLRHVHHVEWVNELPRFDGVHWEIFQRGFISAVRFDHPDPFFEHADEVLAAAPVQELRLYQFYHLHASRLAGVRGLRQVRTLDLNDGSKVANLGLEALMGSRHLKNLTTLLVGRNSLGSAGVRAIAMSGYVRGLRTLRLNHNDLYDDGLRFIAESRALTQLEHLDLDQTRTGDDGVKALARTRHLKGLRKLYLSNNQVTDEGLAALAASDAVSEVRELFLRANSITGRGIAALARSPHFGRLERLHLRQNRIGDDGAVALARSPHLGNLRELYVGQNLISDQAEDELRTRFRWRVNPY